MTSGAELTCFSSVLRPTNFVQLSSAVLKHQVVRKPYPAAADLQDVISQWLEKMLGESLGAENGLQTALESGVRLCNLINVISPGTITRKIWNVQSGQLNLPPPPHRRRRHHSSHLWTG